MKPTVFEDPCPTPGHGLQDFLDDLCKRSKEKHDDHA